VAIATRPSPVFSELVEDYLAYLELDRGLSPNTLGAYRTDLAQLDRFLAERGRPPEAVEEVDLIAFLASLAGGAGERPPVASATLQRKIACLRSFFRHLARQHLIDRDPTVGLRAPRKQPRLPGVLTREEVERLLRQPAPGAPAGLRDRALLGLMYGCGLRATEAIELELADLDLAARRLRTRAGGAKQRVVPVRGDVAAALRAWLEHGRPRLARERGESRLFLNRSGHGLTRQGLYKIVQRHARTAGLEGRLSPHTLRHTFATHMLADGCELRALQELLGHADIATTQVYRQMSAGRLAAAPAAGRHR
jgi:integrase/recombinase XerD